MTTAKKQRTEPQASEVASDPKTITTHPDEVEEEETHDLTSSDDDAEEPEEPEEPVPQSEGEDYETDNDLDYDSGWVSELQEEEQRFSYGVDERFEQFKT